MSTRTVSSVRWPGFTFAVRFVVLVGKDTFLLLAAMKPFYLTQLAMDQAAARNNDGVEERKRLFHAGRVPSAQRHCCIFSGKFSILCAVHSYVNSLKRCLEWQKPKFSGIPRRDRAPTANRANF